MLLYGYHRWCLTSDLISDLRERVNIDGMGQNFLRVPGMQASQTWRLVISTNLWDQHQLICSFELGQWDTDFGWFYWNININKNNTGYYWPLHFLLLSVPAPGYFFIAITLLFQKPWSCPSHLFFPGYLTGLPCFTLQLFYNNPPPRIPLVLFWRVILVPVFFPSIHPSAILPFSTPE